jgi:hypothetical protein
MFRAKKQKLWYGWSWMAGSNKKAKTFRAERRKITRNESMSYTKQSIGVCNLIRKLWPKPPRIPKKLLKEAGLA